MFKRIGLLILANLAIFIMLSVILTVVQMVFGINFGGMVGSSLNMGHHGRFEPQPWNPFHLRDGGGLLGFDHLAPRLQDDGEDDDGPHDD